MSEPPELWTFVATNFVMLGFGAVLTGLSYFAYRANDRSGTFRDATIGFGLITLGGLAEPIYQLVIRADPALDGRELLAVQTVEGGLIGVGLGVLFYSIYRHDRRRGRTEFRTGSVGVGEKDP